MASGCFVVFFADGALALPLLLPQHMQVAAVRAQRLARQLPGLQPQLVPRETVVVLMGQYQHGTLVVIHQERVAVVVFAHPRIQVPVAQLGRLEGDRGLDDENPGGFEPGRFGLPAHHQRQHHDRDRCHTVFHAVAPVEEGNSIDHAGDTGPCNGSENAVALAVGNAEPSVGSALHRAYAHASVHIIYVMTRGTGPIWPWSQPRLPLLWNCLPAEWQPNERNAHLAIGRDSGGSGVRQALHRQPGAR